MIRARFGLLAAFVIALMCAVVLVSVLREHTSTHLPLSDTAIIRAQASEKQLDPALIAAVIYAESKFEPSESSAGAQGLMQILPATAYYLAQLSGWRTFIRIRSTQFWSSVPAENSFINGMRRPS